MLSVLILFCSCINANASTNVQDKYAEPLLLLNDIKGENQWVIFKDKDNCRYMGAFERAFPVKVIKKVCKNKVEDIDMLDMYAILNSATKDSNFSQIKAGSVFLLVDKDMVEDKNKGTFDTERISF